MPDASLPASDDARVLSAHYAIDTLVNHHPCTSTDSPATTMGETKIGWMLPTLSPAMLAFLTEHHEAS